MSAVLCLVLLLVFVFFFKQKTAYELRISDWSSDVCSSDLDRSLCAAGRFPLLCRWQGNPVGARYGGGECIPPFAAARHEAGDGPVRAHLAGAVQRGDRQSVV